MLHRDMKSINLQIFGKKVNNNKNDVFLCFKLSAFFLNAALHQLQVYSWQSEPRPASSVQEQLLSLSPPRHPRPLSSVAHRLPHTQPHVHDGAQVSSELQTSRCTLLVHLVADLLTLYESLYRYLMTCENCVGDTGFLFWFL